MTHEEAFARIRDILTTDFKVPEAKVTNEATFRGTLGMDSLDAVDLIYLLGKAFKVKASVDAFKDLHTVQKVTEYLVKVSPAPPAGPGGA